MTAIAFEEGAGLNRQCMVKDVAFNMCRGREMHFARADRTDDVATDDGLLGSDLSVHYGFFADGYGGRVDVTFDLAVNLDVARCIERSNNC